MDEGELNELRSVDIKIGIKHREWQEAIAQRQAIVDRIIDPLIITSQPLLNEQIMLSYESEF